MVANETNQLNNKKGIVAVIGRWMPIHNGHKAFLIKLAREYEKIVIMIGSCYENGTQKNCIPASERKKMLTAILKKENIPSNKYEITPVADTETFEEWIDIVKRLCNSRGVTHFCTGNKKDILDVLEKKGETLGFEMINPEADSDFPYHATDIRRLIIEGNYEKLQELIPEEIKPILFRYSFKEILAGSRNCGIKFVKGRQTVDVVLLIRNTLDGKVYVLLGKRNMKKVDFPGYFALPGDKINEFENAIDAAIRTLYDKTGLQLQMLDDSLEPAIVRFSNVPNHKLEQMFIVGIYSSEDEKLAGTRGGSSQCFGVFIEDELYKYQEYLEEKGDLTEVDFYEINEALTKGLAYQHEEMLRKAITISEAYPDLKKPMISPIEEEKSDSLVISFVGASGAGKSTAALGTAYNLKKKGESVEYVQEFAKDLLYKGLLGKYIPNQSYIIAEQYKRIYDIIGQTDYIITDAGLEISALHSSTEDKVVEQLAWYLKSKLNQITIFIERDEKNVAYEAKGRKENEAESRTFGIRLEKYLKENNVEYIKVVGSDAAVKVALDAIEEYRKNRKLL